MTLLIYHLEKENDSNKNLLIRCMAPQKMGSKEQLLKVATSLAEKNVLERFLKSSHFLTPMTSFHFIIPFERSWEVVKSLGTTGRVFVQGKKIVVDPFIAYEVQGSVWKLGSQKGSVEECQWVTPAWVLHGGFLREVHLVDVPAIVVEPLPLLILTDRHGAFADLWFDYGTYGRVAAHDMRTLSYRSLKVEKQWERDLLETDYIKKIVDSSNYYCPLNKVVKSLTFLLEIGWTIYDAQGKKVMRQKPLEIEVEAFEKQVQIKAHMNYGEHQINLKHLMGAFTRKEQFVSLSPNQVMLFDREDFSKDWGDLSEEEIVVDTLVIPKHRAGFLQAFTEENSPLKPELKAKIAQFSQLKPSGQVVLRKNFRGNLFPYQLDGLKWLHFLREGGFSGLLADEMGLGKTVQVLAFFSTLEISAPLLVVAPTSLLFNWQREIERFLPECQVYRHEGKERLSTLEELRQQTLILTSYALLRIDADQLLEIDYQMVVLDEAQTIKNGESQIATLCCRLRCKHKLAITGTPIENRLEDLWSLFRFLEPDLLGERSTMQPQMFSLIKKKIKPFLLRRTKAQVALDLPAKLEQTVFVEMSEPERTIYDRWLQKTRLGVLKKVQLETAVPHRMEILEAILRLRQLCAHPLLVEKEEVDLPCAKLERLLIDLEEVIGEQKKVLIYSQFTSMLRLIRSQIETRGWKYVYLDGGSKEREKVVEQFQNDPATPIFLISLKAGGVGLNLTAADYVFLYDPWWNEAVERQAIDRAHRVGREGTVIARRYIAALSIEEKIMRLKTHKVALSRHFMESEEGLDSVTLEDLLLLLSD